jgi:pimeloyl-ACP methyl ester carboxylesterase
MVAQALIRDYPHRVRAAVLYAPVPLSGLAHHAETYLATFGRALDKLFALCRRQPACNAAYPHLKKTFGETVQMLEKRPLQVPLNGQVPGLQTYVVNAQDFIEILHGHMHQSEMAGLPALIEAFHERNVKRLRPIVEPTLHDDGLDRATYYSVTCHDGPPSRRARRRLTSAWPSLEETVGIAWDLGGVACGYWESGQASAAALNPGSSDTPVLVIHGSLDPIISTEDVTTVMESYPRSRVIELPGAGHAPSQRTIACTAHLFAAFYRHPSASLDTTCVKKLPPLLFKLPEAD